MSDTTKTDRVRYAVVGLGHIAQVAVLPAFRNLEHATPAALVSGDAKKRRLLARKYDVTHTYSYDDLDRCLAQGDAVIITLPNAMHAKYTIQAADAGVHVLCEKPLASTVEDGERMVRTCREAGVKLMTAYRLHFEPINLAVVEAVRSGAIGDPKFFVSTFSMRVKEDNVRADRELGGGSVFDLGVYCINAARYVLDAEPTEVVACVTNSVPDRLPEIDESTTAILRFEGERLASFVSSFNAADLSWYRVAGTEGEIHVEPAFEYRDPLAYTVTINGKKTRHRGKRTDQFAAELTYFSDCILENRDPEPSGEEGLQDVRIVQAIYESAEIGRAVAIPPYRASARPRRSQTITHPPAPHVRVVGAESPHH
jgi:glucose-fructose oxidoreductase